MDSKESSLKEMILWWERKRLIYNILVIGSVIFILYSYWDLPMRKMMGAQQVIIHAVVLVFGANLFYTLGWGSGIVNYYLSGKTYVSSKRRRKVFFVLGTVFSLFWILLNFTITLDALFAD